MQDYVPEEYKKEILGTSVFNSKKYENFAPAYIRSLYLHGAHDIGHALQDFMLVGCTSFAAWDSKTLDGELLVGRNFDFYVGDEFAQQKIVAFVNPDEGHKFSFYTWAGFIGVVSGMNDKGITVTINAGKSAIPLKAKMPISLLAREILQYSGSIEEAVAIAKKREVFVSESIMVTSGAEKKAILIEISPKNIGVFEVENSDKLVCSNHFQSDAYENDKRNEKARIESHSNYRFKRMTELVERKSKLKPEDAVAILRNRQGVQDKDIGFGNEKAINQLLAHHGVVFQPAEGKVWFSANPYQMGKFVAYDLEEAFRKFQNKEVSGSVSLSEELIPESEFIYSEEFQNYEAYRKLESHVQSQLDKGLTPSISEATKLTLLNPEFWEAWYLSGMIYYENSNFQKAFDNFEKALEKEVTTLPDREKLEKMLRKTKRKL